MSPDENNDNIGDEVATKENADHRNEIAAWLRGVMESKPGLKPTNWSIASGVGRNTVGRALNPKYTNILSVSSLYKLAKEAGVPAPVHLGSSVPGVPPAEALAAIFRGILSRLTPDRDWSDDVYMALGEALQISLVELQENPEIADNLGEAETVGRVSTRRLSGRGNNPDKP